MYALGICGIFETLCSWDFFVFVCMRCVIFEGFKGKQLAQNPIDFVATLIQPENEKRRTYITIREDQMATICMPWDFEAEPLLKRMECCSKWHIIRAFLIVYLLYIECKLFE